jgi:hypothetical protein
LPLSESRFLGKAQAFRIKRSLRWLRFREFNREASAAKGSSARCQDAISPRKSHLFAGNGDLPRANIPHLQSAPLYGI